MVDLLTPNAYSTSGLNPGAKLFQAKVDRQYSVSVVVEPDNSTRTFCDCKNSWVCFGRPDYKCKHVVEVLEHVIKGLEMQPDVNHSTLHTLLHGD